MDDAKKKMNNLRATDLIKAVLPIKGKPIDMEGYKPFEDIYNINPPTILLRSSRQVGKSLLLSNKMLSRGILSAHSAALYVAPLSMQTSRFSTMYLDPGMASPLVKKYFTNANTKRNVFEKSLSNGSLIFLGYASDTASTDRLRGISISGPGPFGATCYIDEIQDIQNDALGIIYETMTAAERPTKILAGTAKSENNTLELNWARSSQNEWCVKCEHCGRWAIPNDLDTCLRIVSHKQGPGCPHCGGLLDMSKGQWLSGRPDEKNNIGFHVAAFILPIRSKPGKWGEILEKLETYPKSQFANEVLGVPSSRSGRILSIREAMECCNPDRKEWDQGFPMDSRGILFTTIGVDWAVASSEIACRTVVSVLGFDMTGKCYVLYTQKLDGIDVIEQVQRVRDLYYQYRCSALGSDRGVGVPQGILLKRHIGDDYVHMINYVTAKNALRIDRQGGFFAADRTSSIDLLIFKAKAGLTSIETPAWELTAPFWQEPLNLFEETSNTGRRLYTKLDEHYDDVAHSWVFGLIAAQILRGDFTQVDEKPVESAAFDF
jgi:hypothetical protein